MQSFIWAALLSAAVASAAEVCNTPSYVPCPANSGSGSGGGGSGVYQGSGFVLPPPSSSGSGPVQGVAIDPIQVSGDDDAKRKRDLYDRTFGSIIVKRDSGLCCQPSPIECMTVTDPTSGDIIPYCYNPSTTRCYFLGGDVYFVNNETYIAADGTVADFATGRITYPNGTTEIFAVSSSSATSSATVGPASSAPTSHATTTTAGAAGTPVSTPATSSTTKPNDAPASLLYRDTTIIAVAVLVSIVAAF